MSMARVGGFCLLAAILAGECVLPADAKDDVPAPRVVFAGEGWPLVLELSVGQSHEVAMSAGGKEVRRTVKLLGVEHEWEPDWWVGDNADRKTIRSATVRVEVSGAAADLRVRPFELPREVNGLRLYVETTRTWATHGKLAAIGDMQGDVRLSARPAGAAWGPALRFPIADFRWRSSTYNNTWSALVPYNLLYYHRGEDFGAIPDRLPVLACTDAEIAVSPLPAGDGKSNSIALRLGGEVEIRLAHVNIESVEKSATVGAKVRAGQALAKTGSTWNGRRSQDGDPHLHVGLKAGGTPLSPYPLLVEAYLRDYDDPVLPVAGGYAFATPGQAVELDAARSVARPGRKIASYRWTLHDGGEAQGPRATAKFGRPGLYSEELSVRTDDGREDRDFLQVRVYDPNRPGRIARGWVHHAPVRGARPGQEVLFWNRLSGLAGPATIDFGDGGKPSAFPREARHAFDKAGLYTVTVRGSGPGDEPATVKLRVAVEAPAAGGR
jgi:murein DD-endopeptidase MepM/ murein hydrolase activator NlpD